MSDESSDKIENFDDVVVEIPLTDDPNGASMIVREYSYDQLQLIDGTMLAQLDFVSKNIIGFKGFKVRGKEPAVEEIRTWPKSLVAAIVAKYWEKFTEKPEESPEQQAAKKK